MATQPKPNPTPLPSPGGGSPTGAPIAKPTATSVPITLNKTTPTYPTGTEAPTGPVVSVNWDQSFQGMQSLTFGLTVTDSLKVTSTNVAQVTVTLQALPVAVISGPGTVSVGMPITLDGSKSTGVGLNYTWTLVSSSPTPAK
jgi:hypothetical protein